MCDLSIHRLDNLESTDGGTSVSALLNKIDFPSYKVSSQIAFCMISSCLNRTITYTRRILLTKKITRVERRTPQTRENVIDIY